MSSSPEVKIEPALARSVRFSDKRLYILLDDGREIGVPVDRFPRLARASAAEREDWKVNDFATAVRWPALDEDIGVATLLGVPEWLVEQAAGFETHDLNRVSR